MSQPLVVVVGDLVTDILAIHNGLIEVGSDTMAEIAVTGGGSAANTAAWLASTGLRAELVAVVGADSAGTARVAELAAAGVGHDAVRRSEEASTGSVIVLVRDDERSFLCDRGANALLESSDVDKGLASGLTHLHLSGYTLLHGASRTAGRYALEVAHEQGATTSVDAASAAPLRRLGGERFLEWISGTDLLFANVDEARALLRDDQADPRDLAVELTRFARHALVKLGPDGALWADADGGLTVAAAVPADLAVDPTGAGDAFAAGVLRAWLDGAGPEACLTAGTRLGARAVAHLGGRPRSD